MNALRRWAATGAAVFAVIGAATWNQPSATTGPGTKYDGAQLFLAKGCSSCHTGPDTTASIGAGFPSLAEAPTWAADRRANLSAEDYLTESIESPWNLRRLSVLDMKESNEFTQGFESAAL